MPALNDLYMHLTLERPYGVRFSRCVNHKTGTLKFKHLKTYNSDDKSKTPIEHTIYTFRVTISYTANVFGR